MARFFYFFAPFLILLSGCVHLGQQLHREPLPAGAPDLKEILQDLKANEAKIQSFEARGRFLLKLPDQAAIYSLRNSQIVFQQPAHLFVDGRKYGTVAVRLWSDNDSFLLVFPKDKTYYYRVMEDEEALALSPVQVARELFLASPWEQVRKRDMAVTAFESESQTATVEIRSSTRPKYIQRRLIVQGRPWVIKESQLLTADGEIVATTRRNNYRKVENVHFPAKLETVFADEQAMLKFDMTQNKLNVPVDEEALDMRKALDEVRQKGYTPLSPELLEESIQ